MARRKVLSKSEYLSFVDRDGWTFVTRNNASGVVMIVAVTDDDELVLIEQFRKPMNARVIELPAGLAGDVKGEETESLARAARRELLEETGFKARSMRRVVTGTTSPGLTDETITILHARGLTRVDDGGGDGSEDIRVHLVPLGRVESWLRKMERGGAIIDLKVYAGLAIARKTPKRQNVKTPKGRTGRAALGDRDLHRHARKNLL